MYRLTKLLSFLLIIFLGSCTKEEQEKIVFVGDSLVRNWDVEKFFPYLYTENLGVDGFRMNDCISLKVNATNDCIVLLIGTNDLPANLDLAATKEFINMYSSLINSMNYKRLYCISILPKNGYNNNNIVIINSEIKKLTEIYGNVDFIDVYEDFLWNGNINPEFTVDGLHLSYKGYELLTEKVSKAICQ